MPFPLPDAPCAPRAIPLATRSCGLASPILLRSELSRTHGRLLHSLRRSGEARIDSRTSRSVVDRLVGRGPEVETDIRRTGGRPGALGHQDPDHALLGVRTPRGAQAAIPAERSEGPGHVLAPGDHGQAEPPTVTVEVAGDQTGRRFLLGRQLVGRRRTAASGWPEARAISMRPSRALDHPPLLITAWALLPPPISIAPAPSRNCPRSSCPCP